MKKGDTVALMLGNRWEFIPSDLAAVSLGAVPFSIYQTLAPEQIQYVVSDAGARIAIIESAWGSSAGAEGPARPRARDRGRRGGGEHPRRAVEMARTIRPNRSRSLGLMTSSH